MSVISYIKKAIRQRPVLFLVLVVFFLYLQYLPKSYNKDQINRLFEPITSKYGIEIVYEIGDDFFSPIENPPIPAGPRRNSKVKPIKYRVLAQYPTILEETFGKYPVSVIKNYLNAIFFAGEIDDGGLRYGGTYDSFRKILYIVDSGNKNDTRSIYAIHHELSSLLLAKHSFFINPWIENNPEGFKYIFETNDDLLEIYSNISLIGTKDDYEKGFVTDYGRTDFENDFNEYSAMIFTYPDKFKKIMNQHPRIRAKFKVWLEFYQKIDPIFTEAYLLGED